MSHDPIPDDTRDLIQRHIDSVAQLEALLFLRARPSEGMAIATIASKLYAPEAELARSLAQLVQDGFLVRENDLFRYQCSGARRTGVDRLAEAYSRHLIPITNLIHAKPRNIRQFSDAFKFRASE